MDFIAFAIHRIVRVSSAVPFQPIISIANSADHPLRHAYNLQDDIVIFSAPTAYFLVADPHFGLSLLVTMSLTELINGIFKLYCIRPRPLWVSTTLRRMGSVWEKVCSILRSRIQFSLSDRCPFHKGFIFSVITRSNCRHLIFFPVPRREGPSSVHCVVIHFSRDGSPRARHRVLKSIPRHALRF